MHVAQECYRQVHLIRGLAQSSAEKDMPSIAWCHPKCVTSCQGTASEDIFHEAPADPQQFAKDFLTAAQRGCTVEINPVSTTVFFRTPSRIHDVTCHVVALGVTYHVYRWLFGTLRLLRDTGTMWESPHGLERREALLSMTCSENPVRQSAEGARCVFQVNDGPQHVLELRLQRNTAQSPGTACLTLVSSVT